MNRSEPAEAVAPEQSERGILCGRCEHLNHQGETHCGECGARLFVECPACGELNQRVFTRCRKCHKRLHGGLFHRQHRRGHGRLSWRSLKQRLGASFFQVVLVLVALGLAYLVFRFLN
jgi:predicted amidophosphoribosyltransferase